MKIKQDQVENLLYINANPTPSTIGGISSGSTFDGQTTKEVLDLLLYPYQSPTFSSFTFGQSSPIQVGVTVSGDKTFTWGTTNSGNVEANSIIITDVTGAATLGTGLANDGSELITIISVQKTSAASHTWRITGTNTESGTFTRDLTISWQWMKYYGEAVGTPLNEAEIESLRVGALSSSYSGTYTFVGGGYKYICYPAALGTATSFKDTSNNLPVPFETVYTVSVTNSEGIATNYNVHRTTNVLGGAITILVA